MQSIEIATVSLPKMNCKHRVVIKFLSCGGVVTMVIEYFQHVRNEMLHYIPAGNSRIIDVGCGAGSFGELLKCEKGVEVWSVEYSPTAKDTKL